MNAATIRDFIFTNIFILLAANVVLIFLILYFSIHFNIRRRFFLQYKKKMLTYIESCQDIKASPLPVISGRMQMLAAAEAIADSSAEHGDIAAYLTSSLGIDKYLITLVRSNPRLYYLKLLAMLRSQAALDTFILLTHRLHDKSALYNCYYGIALLDTDPSQKSAVINDLIASSLAVDRKIELLDMMKLDPGEWLSLLDKEERDSFKLILLRVICDTPAPCDKDFCDRLLPYLKGSFEIRIAAANAISSSGMAIYVPYLAETYHHESEWQVRSVIASSLVRYPLSDTKDLLLEMVHDSSWWVRSNAIRTLSLKGNEGLYLIIDISTDPSDERAAAMAYSFLNSSSDVHNTLYTAETSGGTAG